LHRFRFSGKITTATGFVFLDGLFSVAGACRRICQLAVIWRFGARSKTAGIIVLFAVRKPIIESGHHVVLNPRAPQAAAEAAAYEAVYAYCGRSCSMWQR
jgi:hypothetical protein